MSKPRPDLTALGFESQNSLKIPAAPSDQSIPEHAGYASYAAGTSALCTTLMAGTYALV